MGDDPDVFIGYTIARLAHVLERRTEAALRARTGLSVRAFGVLAQLERDPGIGAAELARRVLITAQSMGPLVEALAARGLVERDRTAGKGHRMAVRLTPAGTSLLGVAYAVARAVSAADLGDLAADATLNARLRSVLDRLLRSE